MYRKIIAGHDLHEGGEDALALAKQLADASGAELIVAGVFPFGLLPRGFEAEWREQEAKVAAELQEVADSAGALAEAFPSSSPAHGLHDLAEELDADLIVVGSSRHSSLGQVLAGNVGRGLLHGSPCAVAIAPKGYRENAGRGLGEIRVGFDASAESGLALVDGVDLARAAHQPIKLVAVAEPPPIVYGPGGGTAGGYRGLEEAIEKSLREQLDEAMRTVPDGVRAEASLVSGDPVERLAEAASGGGVLVLGSRAYGPLRRVLLGSVSSELVRNAPCPVIVHPRGTTVTKPRSVGTTAGSAA